MASSTGSEARRRSYVRARGTRLMGILRKHNFHADPLITRSRWSSVSGPYKITLVHQTKSGLKVWVAPIPRAAARDRKGEEG